MASFTERDRSTLASYCPIAESDIPPSQTSKKSAADKQRTLNYQVMIAQGAPIAKAVIYRAAHLGLPMIPANPPANPLAEYPELNQPDAVPNVAIPQRPNASPSDSSSVNFPFDETLQAAYEDYSATFESRLYALEATLPESAPLRNIATWAHILRRVAVYCPTRSLANTSDEAVPQEPHDSLDDPEYAPGKSQ